MHFWTLEEEYWVMIVLFFVILGGSCRFWPLTEIEQSVPNFCSDMMQCHKHNNDNSGHMEHRQLYPVVPGVVKA